MEYRAKPWSALASVAAPILIVDSVFRALALAGMLYSFGTYWSSIGAFYTLLKLAMYAGGIAANVAILQGRQHATTAGFVVAGVGVWLVLIDASALLRFGSSGLSRMIGSMYTRAVLKTITRGVWLVVYVAALLNFHTGEAAPILNSGEDGGKHV